MACKTLLVHVDHRPEAAERVELACKLAHRFGAHLVGFAACPVHIPLADPYTTGGMVVEFLKQEQLRAEESVRKAETTFASVTAAHGCTTEWRGGVGNPDLLLPLESRAADLVIVGRAADGHGTLDLGGVAMDCGRPVLVVPPAPAGEAVPSAVVVAWKETRESRRAVVDALPLLQIAAKVTVAESCAPEDAEAAAKRLGDVALFLARHGVNADPVVLPSGDETTADQLLALAAREQAQLIVMGAYGHARTREWAFGGVTRRMLAHSPVCCLFSH